MYSAIRWHVFYAISGIVTNFALSINLHPCFITTCHNLKS